MRKTLALSISSFVLLVAGVANAAPPNTTGCANGTADAGAACTTDDARTGTCQASMCSASGDDDASADASADAGDAGMFACSVCVASPDLCADDSASCTGLSSGDACSITDASTGVCTTVSCNGASILACEPALGGDLDADTFADSSTGTVVSTPTDGSTNTSTSTSSATCAPHAAECAGHKLGDGCDTTDGNSGNCGEVTCGGVTVLTCVEGKGSSAGGCDIGSTDIASGFALLGFLAPFAAIRRKKNKKSAA